MDHWKWAVRYVGLLAMVVWVGGFTFYSAAVVPILHGRMTTRAAGEITRRVTDRLNLAGAATVTAWLGLVVAERRDGPRGARALRAGLLATTAGLLAALCAMHVAMDRRLDAGRIGGFYPWHRAYLIVSTIQWFVNLGILAASLRVWERD